MASANVDHIRRVAESSNNPGMIMQCVCVCVYVKFLFLFSVLQHVQVFCIIEMKEAASKYSIESILSSIHCYRCHHHIELIAIVNVLSDFIKKHHNQVITFSSAYKITVGYISDIFQTLQTLTCTTSEPK